MRMDWSTVLQVLRDGLTIVGVGKLVHSTYRQIKKPSTSSILEKIASILGTRSRTISISYIKSLRCSL